MLLGRAMGWLGWSEREAMEADVNSVLMALDRRAELLKMIFGGKDADEGEGQDLTVNRVKSFAATQKALWKGRNIGKRPRRDRGRGNGEPSETA